MKKLYFIIMAALLITAPLNSFAKDIVHVDVLYMNHGPMQPTLRELRAVFPKYKDQLLVSWYDVDSKKGIAFKAKMGIKEHIPMVIWVDGKFEVTVDNRKIKFKGFPTGSGPSFFQGEWTIDDLVVILDQKTKVK
ncbi:MAG: hypothetical protein PF690_09125 [Deltaproteobacteria bacterium]|jgi:hypothetical protein|nr:hypothetical protein [Deltaproteobacteria bacterium]